MMDRDAPRSYSFENTPTSSTSGSWLGHESAILVIEAKLSLLLRGEESIPSEGKGRLRNSGVFWGFRGDPRLIGGA